MNNAPDIPRERFTSMMRLDHNRAVAQLANKARRARSPTSPRWACGATTRRRCTPTCSTPRSAASRPPSVVDDQAWIENDFLPERRQTRRRDHRGARRLLAPPRPPTRRSTTSATGSPAPTATGSRWASPPTAPTAIPEGLICGFPCTCADGECDDRRRASRSTTSPARRSTPRSPSSTDERDTVKAGLRASRSEAADSQARTPCTRRSRPDKQGARVIEAAPPGAAACSHVEREDASRRRLGLGVPAAALLR